MIRKSQVARVPANEMRTQRILIASLFVIAAWSPEARSSTRTSYATKAMLASPARQRPVKRALGCANADFATAPQSWGRRSKAGGWARRKTSFRGRGAWRRIHESVGR